MKKYLLPILFLSSSLFLLSCDKEPVEIPPPPGARILPCQIDSNTVLENHNPLGVDYIVNCEVEVVNALLTLDTGVIIVFNPNASLKIAESAAITTTAAAGQEALLKGATNTISWKGIVIESNDNRNKLEHVIVKHAGSEIFYSDVFGGFIYDAKVAIAVKGRANITHTLIDSCGGIGLLYGSDATVGDFGFNTFRYCNMYPLMLCARSLSPDLSFTNSSFAENRENYIALYSISSNTEVDAAVTINEAPVPYLATHSLIFRKRTQFNEGVTLLMNEELVVGAVDQDAIWTINGSASKPVVIKGKQAVAGYWNGLLLANDSLNVFNYLNISDGGRDFTGINVPYKANINVGATSPAHVVLNNCTSTNNADNCPLGKTNLSSVTNNSPAITNICQ